MSRCRPSTANQELSSAQPVERNDGLWTQFVAALTMKLQDFGGRDIQLSPEHSDAEFGGLSGRPKLNNAFRVQPV